MNVYSYLREPLHECRERSGSVVEILTRDRGPLVQASPASLCRVLEQEH